MKRRLLVGFAVASFLVICGWLVYRCIMSNEELASKPEWAAIQIIELQHRDNASDQMEFVTVGEYSIVGLPVHEARKRIWIMLNPRNPPYYKQLPTGSYTLSTEELKTILASGVVTSTVAKCLESHVQDSR